MSERLLCDKCGRDAQLKTRPPGDSAAVFFSYWPHLGKMHLCADCWDDIRTQIAFPTHTDPPLPSQAGAPPAPPINLRLHRLAIAVLFVFWLAAVIS